MSYYLTPNIENNGVYSGDCYVYDASGGFSIERGFPQINLNTTTPITQYNVSDALQLRFSVRILNDKIGVIKDDNNDKVIQLFYDASNDTLNVDSLTVSTDEFIGALNPESVISMGKLSSLYSDFNYTVKQYFGDPFGFSTFFAGDFNFNVNRGVFDASAFINIINGNTFDMVGSYITDLSGYFSINDLNKHLRYITSTNVFNNRPYDQNFDITEGFLEGDLIFIPNGMNITLKLNIEAEPYVNINNTGPLNLQMVDTSLNYYDPITNVQKVTTSSITNITQSYSVPILLILSNTDLFNFDNFSKNWYKTFDSTIKWLAISMSSDGRFQCAIEEYGDIYISNDFGITWTVKYNIGNAVSNSVAMSSSGQYITSSNGSSIYISNNYGNSWTQVYSFGNSNIYVCISLNGQYQTIVSCGDTVYTSNNYGLTWNSLQDNTSDLYNSIEAFPTAGLAMSYNGQYQTIVSETIYLSHDYGVTWFQPIMDQFEDRNWISVAMSSNGQYQTALDSGGDVYTSSDYGNTWNYIDNPIMLDNEWQCVRMSATGKYQTAIEKFGTIYFSIDYGVTWTMSPSTNIINRNWQALAISSNAQYQTAVEYDGSIYISKLM